MPPLAHPPLSLYLHFPWCVRKCPYCDFNSYTLHGELAEDRYIDAIERDIESQAPDVSGRDFYTATDRPVLETLVHNLEHGYTILWYDGTKVKDTTLLKDVADQANKEPEASGKFKVVEWDPSRGAFPADKPYALSHWAKDAGHRQLCGDLSGQVVVDFVKKYPKDDTQEPGAA